MKVNPYLYFNGNCTEAIALYEKAFHVQAEVMPHEDTENLVGHAAFAIGGDSINRCDAEHPVQIGDNMMITIHFDEPELAVAKAAFNTLKEGGQVIMELEENAWSKCFGILVDPFGVKWNMCGGLK